MKTMSRQKLQTWPALFAVLIAALLLIAALGGGAARAETPPDYDISGGHFFTQGAPAGSPTGSGFGVTDEQGIPFWTTYQDEGGLLRMGYPLSGRFVRDDLVTQVMQKVVFQWHPGAGVVEFVNVLDELNYAGRDAWLEDLLVPAQAAIDETGLDLHEREVGRLALLSASPPIEAFFNATDDPIRLFGLPTSAVVDYGSMEAIRLQRAVLQLWKVETEFARPGDVLIANGGQLAVRAGLFDPAALVPEVRTEAPEPDPTAVPTATSTGDPVLDRINHFRALAGVLSLPADPALMRATQNHADYYVQNGGGAHTETPGLPGFTGASIHDRAVAAGYPLYSWVDEDVAFNTDAVNNIDLFIATVFHRLPLLHPSAIAIGFATASGNGRAIMVIDLGLDQNYDPGLDLPVVYPGPGQIDVPRLWYAYESPNPVPGVPNPVGSPLTVSFLINQSVQWGAVSLVSSGGVAVEVILAEGPTWRRALGIVPRYPMEAGTTYTATVTGTVDGAAFSHSWSFTTAP